MEGAGLQKKKKATSLFHLVEISQGTQCVLSDGFCVWQCITGPSYTTTLCDLYN